MVEVMVFKRLNSEFVHAVMLHGHILVVSLCVDRVMMSMMVDHLFVMVVVAIVAELVVRVVLSCMWVVLS